MADMNMCRNAIPWASLFSMIIAITGCVIFTLSFSDGMSGFLYQLNIIATMTNSSLTSTIRSIMFKIAAIFCFSVIIILVINVFSTSAISSSSSSQNSRPQFIFYRILSSRRTVAITIGYANIILMFWLLLLCISSMALIVYLVFYISMQQFCAFVDTQCFDFRILIPVVKRLTNDKVDLIFCKEKKQAICETSHVSNFFISFFSCCLAVLGIVYFLMCMASNYARLSLIPRGHHHHHHKNSNDGGGGGVSKRKGQHFSLNMGTVDSDSIIMHSMEK